MKRTMLRRLLHPACVSLAALVAGCAVSPMADAQRSRRAAPQPAPQPAWDRVYHNDEVIEFMRGYARAYPDLVTLRSIGESLGGSEMWLLTINNSETGDAESKPAMYVDGCIHANEAQATDTVLYTIDYLLRNYGELHRVTQLVDRAVFHFVPIVSPDSRAKWFDEPSTASYPRTVQIFIDDDRDGRVDEDHLDDLDGDGQITQMRKRVPIGEGTHRLHPNDARVLVPVEEGQLGDWITLGQEGIDNDGDGRINEDTIGYVDPNRTWGYGWQPRYVQSGTTQYPLQIPETRSIAEWMLETPNIAAAQSFHNTGGMILRGPGAKGEPPFPPQDIRVYDYLGEAGEQLLPNYNYWIIWEDLYTVYGGTINHTYGVHGAISFTNELYSGDERDLDGDGSITNEERMRFNDRLAMGRMFKDWTPVNHPQYGEIEVGGWRKDTGRMPEMWMMKEDHHRNAMFVLFHAEHLPLVRFLNVDVEPAGDGLWRIYATVRNDRAIPSVTAWAARNNLHRRDIATVEGAQVISSGLVQNRWMNNISLQEHRPQRLVSPGVDGFSTRELFFLVEGDRGDELTLRYDSLKGGATTTTITLE